MDQDVFVGGGEDVDQGVQGIEPSVEAHPTQVEQTLRLLPAQVGGLAGLGAHRRHSLA